MPNNEYFQGNPVGLDTSRSTMVPKPAKWWGSWSTGELVPIFATSLVMPGDTFAQSVSSAIRTIRPVFPVMDDIELTIEAYFVPHRLILSRKSMSPDLNDSNHSWAAFIGAQDSLLNMPLPGDVKLPALQINTSYDVGSLGDCLGYRVPQASGGVYYVNCLKVLAYYSIWNEYFREPNTQTPVTYSLTTDSNAPGGYRVSLVGSDAGIPSGSPSIPCKFPLAPVSRYHGYFGSALPWPQRNAAMVEMPLGDTAPVYAGSVDNPNPENGVSSGYDAISLHFRDAQDWSVPSGNSGLGVNVGTFGSSVQYYSDNPTYGNTLSPANLFADLSSATAASVNQFFLAVQTQRWYEQLARCGNKYCDMVHGMFGVRGISIPDRPEYLGGFTAPLTMSQVAQTTDGSGFDGLGKEGAFSLSNPGGFLYSKSFTEHGTLMIVACCRVNDSFSQGISREDTKFDRFDYYWPQFANLGEQEILQKELFVSGNSNDDTVFGYQEAWAEYRMFNDVVTGYMNPDQSSSLEFATYANVFSSAPTLKGFLSAKGQWANVDRTLGVSGATAGFQFYGEFVFPTKMSRPMPLYSIPGLVDHH